MKLLLDQNISFRVAKLIKEVYTQSLPVSGAGLRNASDAEIREWAANEGYAVVTYDDDFSKYNLLYGPPPKIIWVRKGNLSNTSLALLRIGHKDRIQQFLSGDFVTESGILEIV